MVDPNHRRMRGAGGTPGGLGTFFLGFIMIVAGGYLLTDQVMVTKYQDRSFSIKSSRILLGSLGDCEHRLCRYL